MERMVVETTKKKYDSENESVKIHEKNGGKKREASPFRPNSILRRSKSVFDTGRLGDKYSSSSSTPSWKYNSFGDGHIKNYSTKNRDYNDGNYVSVLDRLGYDKYEKSSYNSSNNRRDSGYVREDNGYNNNRFKRSQSCAPSSSFSYSKSLYYNNNNNNNSNRGYQQNQRDRRRSNSPDKRGYYWKKPGYNNNNNYRYNNNSDNRYRNYTNVFNNKRNYRAQSCAPSSSSSSSSSSYSSSSSRIPLIVSDFQKLYYKSLDDVEVMSSNKYHEKTLLRATIKYLRSISDDFENESENIRNDCFIAGLLAYAYNAMVKTSQGRKTFYAFLSMKFNNERYTR